MATKKKKTVKKSTKKAYAAAMKEQGLESKPTKSNAGRPTKYKNEFCDMVIKIMSEGKSLTGFCAAVGISKQTVYRWGEENQEFSDALEIAKMNCQSWWENIMRGTATGQVKGNAGMQKFWMINRFGKDWQDTIVNENHNIDKTVTVTIGESGDIIKNEEDSES